MRWLASAALVLALLALVGWWLVVFLEQPLTPLVALGAVAAITLMIRLARLQGIARRLR